MAPPGEFISGSRANNISKSKPPRLSSSADSLKRTMSDISYELSKEANFDQDLKSLPPISEVEDAKCECCGMSEECTPEYIDRVRDKFLGKWICGLCSEAVKEEVEKNGGNKEEALNSHISACVKFNNYSRAYPVLFQAEAMREMLKKSKSDGTGMRAKSISPKDKGGPKGKIARSSSCIPAITRGMNDLSMA
ncbi:hypothetical protein D8674_019294 [Pyrus ussuriensis x Pyrus communis]|uniref:DUF1677 family protein n=1 Tax=Pyrus ussuriensis x Pyrus communis TaxID=2448454 RepID=A0A5N5GCT2_9ROSA|nr:hypothetical protein D8674_019294 [Pyrus ussuriensis x Pyrus communis]